MHIFGDGDKEKVKLWGDYLQLPEPEKLEDFLSRYPNTKLTEREKSDLIQHRGLVDKLKSEQPTKDQHYVAKFYLKQFCAQDGLLRVYDLKHKRPCKPTAPSGVCYGPFFYGGKTGEYDFISQLWESIFRDFENKFASQLDGIVSEIISYGKISDKTRWRIAEFMTISHVRTKGFREQLERTTSDAIKQMMPKIYQMYKHHEPDHPKFKPIIDDPEAEKIILEGKYDVSFNHNGSHFDFMSQEWLEEWSTWLMAKRWTILLASGELGFVTSDTPVLELPPNKQRTLYGFHIMERDIHFPLTPKILITLSEPISGKRVKRKQMPDQEVAFYNAIRLSYGQFGYARQDIELSPTIASAAFKAHQGKFEHLFNY